MMYLKKGIFLWFYTVFITIATLKAEFKLTLLHTNDMHSRIVEVNNKTGKCTKEGPCYGGFARLTYQVKKIKNETDNTLFLNAGDTYQGTPMYSLFKWKPLVELMKNLNIDVMSLGNHEFDDGIDGLVPYLNEVNISVAACNIDTTKEPSLEKCTVLKPWHMKTVGDVKIAVIGYITPETKYFSSTGEVTFYDEIEKIKQYAQEAKKAGANLIFAVGHSGFKKDQEIAEQVEDIDVVVGGHTDTFLYTGTPLPDIEKPAGDYPTMIEQTSTGKKVPVVQAFGYTKYLGKLELVWHDNFTLASAKGNPILLDSSVPKDRKIECETSKWTKKLEGILEQSKGITKVPFDGKCRLKECNFGNFIADAFIYYVVNETKNHISKWTDAPICIMNGGGIRSSIESTGSVTWGDLLTALPFGTQIVRLNMKGSVLLKALNRSVERYTEANSYGYGEFLQFSGLKVVYVQNSTGHLALQNAWTRCKNCLSPMYLSLNPNKNYSVVTTLFVSNGGDGFSMLKEEAVKEHIYEEIDLNIVAKYLEQMSPVYPGQAGRIIISKESPPLKP